MKGYGDCKMPLDLSDDQLLSQPSEHDAATAALIDGWSPSDQYHSVTWARLRYLQSAYREKVIGLNNAPLNVENTQRLRSVILHPSVLAISPTLVSS